MLLSCLMVFVVATVAGAGLGSTAGAFVACAAYFAGTVLYVKTMIREHGSASYRAASVAYHAVAIAVVAWWGPVLAVLFGWLLVRACLLPGRRLVPRHVGFNEMGNCLLLVAAIALR